MKYILLISMVLTAGSAALASNPYDRLVSMYATGRAPTAVEVSGERSGRCYRTYQPSTPLNSLLIGWSNDEKANGPIIAPAPVRTLILRDEMSGPDAFDIPGHGMSAGFNVYKKEQMGNTAEGNYANGALEGGHAYASLEHWAVRINGETLVARKYENSTLTEMCYYFLKL